MSMNQQSYVHYQSGVSAYTEGKYDNAVERFRIVLDNDPSAWEAKFYLAMSLAQMMQNKAAEAHFRTIMEFCPDTILKHRAKLAADALKSFRQ